MLSRLIYHSENISGGLEGKMMGDLNKIMDASVRNNQRDGITGALLFDPIWFVQILEGEREAISATLRRIMPDPRHDAVTVMDCAPIESRLFGNWWMGLANMNVHSALLARHGLGPRLDPRKMSGAVTLALAVDVARAGLNRQVAAAA
ncbi:MAG: BLUF domain-containing protein [Pseudolabrys sp.]|nr:BLUF domain-containing protein [Pseudolabrys sp.]